MALGQTHSMCLHVFKKPPFPKTAGRCIFVCSHLIGNYFKKRIKTYCMLQTEQCMWDWLKINSSTYFHCTEGTRSQRLIDTLIHWGISSQTADAAVGFVLFMQCVGNKIKVEYHQVLTKLVFWACVRQERVYFKMKRAQAEIILPTIIFPFFVNFRKRTSI